MNTIRGSFARAFKGKISGKQTVKVPLDAEDSDSDTEARSQEAQKAARRNLGKKNGNAPKRKSEFKPVKMVTKVKVDYHQHSILSIEDNINAVDVRDEEIVIPQQRWFNAQNGSSEADNVSPYDYPAIKAMLTTSRSDIWSEDALSEMRAQVEIVNREWEESYLCEPDLNQNEKPCFMGQECEGLKIEQPEVFILKEYYTPLEFKQKKNGSGDLKMCLLCLRTRIWCACLSIRGDSLGLRVDGILQHYANITGLDREYLIDDCECSLRDTYEGLVLPIVRHKRSSFTLKIKRENGIDKRWYIQTGYAFPNTSGNHFQPTAPLQN
jgi:hypothetical protein